MGSPRLRTPRVAQSLHLSALFRKSAFLAIHLPSPFARIASSSQLPRRNLSTAPNMADLKVELTAPNGVKFTLPTGLFINNEFVKSTSGEKITSINPT